MKTEPSPAGPGPREERGGAASSRVHPPHVTENDRGAPLQERAESAPVPALPANAQGSDTQPAEGGEIREDSMYGGRPGEDKDRKLTDMP